MATPSPHPAVNVGLNMWKELVTPNVANTHLILYSALFGSHLWHGFIAGPIGFKTLPRQTFGLLQSKLFPAFFGAGTVVPAALIANLLISVGGRISTIPTFPLVNLAIISITNAVNWLYLGPRTTRIMFERHRLEKEEGIDAYKDKDKVSCGRER